MRTNWLSWLTALTLVSACEGADAPAEEDALDGEDEAFGSGKADGIDDVCAVLKLVNDTTLHVLDDDVGLHARAAENIIAYRAGLDGEIGTADDTWFQTLEQLDAIKFVGPRALERLQDYTDAGQIACGNVEVQLLAFNDFHGALRPPSGSSGRIQTGPDAAVDRVDAGGVQFMHTHMQSLADGNPNTLVVAAGDVIGATPLLSAIFHDEPTVESMNLLGLDIASVGNHEFDEGLDELLRMQLGGCHAEDGCQDGDGFDGADYHYLAANVLEESSGETVLPPYEIRRFDNASVAFIGLTLEGTPLVTTAAGVEGLSFRDEAETVNALVPEIRAMGVEAIVVLLHEGGAQTGLFNECVGISGALVSVVEAFDPAIDVVVAGHTNAAHVCDIGGKLVTSAASNGRLITDIDLVIDETSGHVVAKTANNVIVTRDVTPDPDQGDLLQRYEAFASPIANRVVGSVAATLDRVPNAAGEMAMGDLIADAQRAAGLEEGASVAFMNPGGIRTDLVFEQIGGAEQPGEVTYGELFAVQPFGNNLVVLSLTGEQIDALLEQQWRIVGGAEAAVMLQVSAGFSYAYDASRPMGDRVDPASIMIDGGPIDLGATYRVVANSFLADGGDGFSVLRAGTQRAPGPVDVDALETFLAAHSPLAAPPLDRITRL